MHAGPPLLKEEDKKTGSEESLWAVSTVPRSLCRWMRHPQTPARGPPQPSSCGELPPAPSHLPEASYGASRGSVTCMPGWGECSLGGPRGMVAGLPVTSVSHRGRFLRG